MRKTLSFAAFLFLTASGLVAQVGSRQNDPSTSNPNANPGSADPFSMKDLQQPVYISGKVILAGGGMVTEPVSIETDCRDRKRVETQTDSQGNFSFEVKTRPELMGQQTADLSNFGGGTFSKDTGGSWHDCELVAILPGFTSEPIPFARVMSAFQTTDFGKITLRPLGNGEGSVLSATSMAAPDSARKALEKARDLEKKNKADDARKSLEKAVEIYPQYAAAWTELGRLQYANHDRAAAQKSFEKALAADAKYAKPYLWLAQMDVDTQQWQAVVAVTDKLLAMNSVGFPGAWFLNATGQYNLKNYDAAAHSAGEGIKLDVDHRIPRMEYLLGLSLAEKSDFANAAEHVRQFLRYTNNPQEVAEAQQVLGQIEQQLSSAGKPQ